MKTYAVTELNVHMIMALKYSSSKHMPSVCLVVYCNISGSSILCCNKTTEFMTHLKVHLMLIGTVWKWMILLQFWRYMLPEHWQNTQPNSIVSKPKKKMNISTEPA